jgi:hypothetical protein
MRLRLGLSIAVILAALVSPATPQALAAGGFASAPLDIATTAIAGGIRITWSTPSDVDNGITGFRIESSSSGNSGTWSLATTVASAVRSHDLLGLSQVATYIRVAATTSAGTGTYGYPWTKIYGTTTMNRDSSGNVVYESGFGLGAGNASNTHSAANFSRVRYRMDATISGTASYAETDFYKWVRGDTSQATTASAWDASVTSLMIPTINSPNQYIIQANVTDLNIFSDSSFVTDTVGSSGINGRLEIWPWNYAPGVSTLADGSTLGSGSTYDFNDTPSGDGNYGSFQVHDMSNYRPVFVWNRSSSGELREIAFGSNRFSGNPDWTFCSNTQCPAPTSFRLQIFVNIPITPLADATPPTVSRIDSRLLGKNGDTITVRSTELGTVYLVNQSVTVTNLASITGAASANRNSVSISAANTNTTLTLASLNSGLYNLYAADSANNLSTAVLATIRVDNDLPTATTIEVNSSGTAIILTASETITNSLQLGGIYTISDSSSVVSVSSTSFSANVATLNLARAIPAGSTVNFAYSPLGGAAGGRWIDQAGNEMAAISSRTITNNSAAAITVTLTVPTSISKGTSVSISVALSVAGRVTFSLAGKRIPGCFNRVATGSTPITISCNFKPALTGQQTIRAVLVPTIGAYPTTVTSVERFILKRSASR